MNTYLRFVIFEIDDDSLVEMGLFSAMGKLQDSGELFPFEEKLEAEIYQWFKKNLPVPTNFKSRKNTNQKAISWFKVNASEHLEKIRSYIQILEAHNLLVKQLKTQRPGKIVYEDDFQIAAVPFHDTFK